MAELGTQTNLEKNSVSPPLVGTGHTLALGTDSVSPAKRGRGHERSSGNTKRPKISPKGTKARALTLTHYVRFVTGDCICMTPEMTLAFCLIWQRGRLHIRTCDCFWNC